MSKIAYIFPGQGSQYVSMGKSFYDSSEEIKKIYLEANNILGFDIAALSFEGPQEELTKTENCQPAILLASIAALIYFKNKFKDISPVFYAGLSLGEYTALVAADSIVFNDALSLVRKRGQLMEQAAAKNPGKMASVLGLDLDKVRMVCQKSAVETANINCPGQVVISGKHELIEQAKGLLTAEGAKRIIDLDVSGAFHSSLMMEAANALRVELDKINIKDAAVPVVSNVDGLPHLKAKDIKDNLVKQLYSSVYWQKCMEYMISAGVVKFFEVGPGKVLKGLARKIDENVQVSNIEKSQDLESLAV